MHVSLDKILILYAKDLHGNIISLCKSHPQANHKNRQMISLQRLLRPNAQQNDIILYLDITDNPLSHCLLSYVEVIQMIFFGFHANKYKIKPPGNPSSPLFCFNPLTRPLLDLIPWSGIGLVLRSCPTYVCESGIGTTRQACCPSVNPTVRG